MYTILNPSLHYVLRNRVRKPAETNGNQRKPTETNGKRTNNKLGTKTDGNMSKYVERNTFSKRIENHCDIRSDLSSLRV